MGHMRVLRSWRTLGWATMAFLVGPLGQGGVPWAVASGPPSNEESRWEAAAHNVAPAEVILDVLVSPEPLGTRLVVVGDGEFGHYKVSLLREPPRIVLDLWGIHKSRFQPLRFEPTREIQRIRVGRHEDHMRLVADVGAKGTREMPLYSVQREGTKLVLCIGEMARGGPVEQADPAQPSLAGPQVQGKGQPEKVIGAPPLVRTQEPGPGEERFLSRKGSPDPTAGDSLEVVSFTPRVWDPKPPEALGENQVVEEAVEAHSQPPGPGLLEESQLLASQPQPPALDRERPVKTAKVTETKVGPLEAVPSGDQSKDGSLMRAEPVRASHLAAPQAVSLAQVAAKAPLKSGVPAGTFKEEEEEEEFKISTGMEPGKTYSGQRLDLDLQDIDLDNIFRLLAEVSNLNIIVSEKVKGKVTMRLKNVPWDQALDLILSTQKLGMVRQGNILRVAPLKDLMDEEKERKRLRQERIQARIEAEKRIQEAEIESQERQRKLRPFVTEFIVLNYTKAKDFKDQIKDILTKEPKIDRVGTAVVDDRTNTVTVTDYAEKIERIKQYKERVDKPTPQVLIEARIVKASKNFARELGVQWGTQFAEFDRKNEWAWGISSATSTTGTTPPTSPSTWKSGAFSGGTGHDFFPLSGWMVNLPATILPGPPGIGLQIGRLAGDLINLDLRLSAAEREGLTKIVSRPKVMTLDNVEATIKQGREIPFTQVNPEGNVSVVYKEASLKTTVTPQISPDGRVRLKLDVTDDFPDRANANPITGNPEIVKRQGTTEVLVRDGETVVIGGVLEETRATAEDGVPWLKDVPGLSWLFERKQRRLDQTELLIFVTPFIVQQT
jgi:type IV pilus assembly protein PilQ